MPETATLQVQGKTYQLPVVIGTEGEVAVDRGHVGDVHDLGDRDELAQVRFHERGRHPRCTRENANGRPERSPVVPATEGWGYLPRITKAIQRKWITMTMSAAI